MEFKLLVLGSQGSGKSSYIKRCTENSYNEDYQPTNELKESNITSELDNISYNIQISEKPNSEPFENFFKDYDGFIIFSDLKTKENALELKEKIGRKYSVFFIESKCDLLEEKKYEKEKDKVKNFTEENDFNGGFLVSSKTGKNINESFQFIVKELIDRVRQKKEAEEIKIDNEKDIINIYTYKNEGNQCDELYQCKVNINELKEDYDILESIIDARNFVELVNMKKEINDLKINFYLKKVVIQISILFFDLLGDKEELTFELVHKDLNPEDLPKILIEKLIEEKELNNN